MQMVDKMIGRRPYMDIQFNQVSKQFDQKTVFYNLNLTFLEGRISCLMGPSGIGKTTVLNIMMGLIKPDSGEVLGLGGRRLAAVFQEDRLIEHWNAVKNIKLVCDWEISEERIKKELREVGITEEQNQPVSCFSGGMRQRVAIVRAMMADSDLIILDEPFRGLDEKLKTQVIEYIKKKTRGKTVIVVTHETEDADLLDANLIKIP
jgi:NitT/TauT family transport system ATP-binding protein